MIVTNENVLRMECEDVLPEEVAYFRELLEKELENSAKMGRPGIGLALPQINIHKKMAIVRLGPGLNIDLVNCSIKNKYDEFVHKEEGCLSFPGRLEDVVRYKEVHIVNNLVSPKEMILTGLLAVCAQHEIDHYNGVLLIDRVAPKAQRIMGPNVDCFCGSKLKYKKCHGKKP